MHNGAAAGAFDLRYFDTLAGQDTPLHRLDPRAQLATTAIFIITVISFPKYGITALLPFFIYPSVLLAVSRQPVTFIARKMLLVAPFAILVGIANPWFDRAPMVHLGAVAISGGWISFTSIILKFLLTVSAALLLLGCTGMNGICSGLRRLGIPGFFTTQLLLLYRYLFVMTEEAGRMLQARALRAPRRRFQLHDAGIMLGQLLLRSLTRAERIYLAMRSRGFDGIIRQANDSQQLCWRDWLFVLGWSALFILCRTVNISQLLGRAVLR